MNLPGAQKVATSSSDTDIAWSAINGTTPCTFYANNEGWAAYSGTERGNDSIFDCNLDPGLLDWTEAMVGSRMLALAQALSPDRDIRSRKMLEVLEANKGSIRRTRPRVRGRRPRRRDHEPDATPAGGGIVTRLA